ncbi:MAG: M42 family metallopeptidase [Candidatus Micrarchaeia archaeon]|jgi:endoglucanase
MATEVNAFLKKLSECSAPAGREDEVASALEAEFKKCGFSVSRDVIGNVIACRGKGGAGVPRIAVVAHMDEIGLAVKSITKEGFLRFAKIGGIFDGMVSNSRVRVLVGNRKLLGIVGSKPPHLMKDEERKRLPEYDAMYVDIGAKSKDEVEKLGIRPGTLIAFDSSFEELEGGLVAGKAFDNRAGCTALVLVARALAKAGPQGFEMVLIGSCREETGLLGAGTSVFGLDPEPALAIALDTNLANGTPDVSEEQSPIKIGGGPSLSSLEASGRGFIAPQKLIEWIEKIAKQEKIPLQHAMMEGGATDASRMQYLKAGLLAASIGIPTRYLHSHSEVLSPKDIESASRLVLAIARGFRGYK